MTYGERISTLKTLANDSVVWIYKGLSDLPTLFAGKFPLRGAFILKVVPTVF